MKVSDFIARYIESKGVRHVFELSGGMITHLLDSFQQKTSVEIISMHHEQAAAFAADAYGRILGIPGIALATSGPGATNLLTGIGSCYFDSSPAVFITGQVNTYEQKGGRHIRQLGFQETDIVAMANCITKKSYKVEDPKEIPDILRDAFELATTGRPGPVLIDIPMNIQRADIEINEEYWETLQLPVNNINLELTDLIYEVKKAIEIAKRPMLLVGRGVKAAFADKELHAFLERTKIPIITSLLAVDTIPYAHPQRVGFIGSYGNRWANIAFGECDMLIVAGSRLDIRQTGANLSIFASKKIFHIDCDVNEINNRVKGVTPIVSDVKVFFKTFVEKYSEFDFEVKMQWLEYINELKDRWPDIKELEPQGINPNVFIHELSRLSVRAAGYLVDVGSHQMWSAQSIELLSNQNFLTSGGMGAMGFALPAAIGACFAYDINPVVAIIGDGSMQINLQELQTIVRNKLPIKIVVLNNRSLGMIRQFQDSYFESRYQSTSWGYSAPDFEKVANAYGIAAKTIHSNEEIVSAVEWLWNKENKNSPLLLQVMINPTTNTYPKIAFGKPITEMEPFAKPIDMEGT